MSSGSVSDLQGAMRRQEERRAREGIPPPDSKRVDEHTPAVAKATRAKLTTVVESLAPGAQAEAESNRGESPRKVGRRRGGRRQAQPNSGSQPSFEAEDALARELEAVERELHYRDTLLPEGACVEAAFVSVAEKMIVGGARKWLAIFRIVEVLAPHDDLVGGGLILRSWNPPSGRWLSPRHALAADWEAVVGRPLRTLPRRYSANALLGLFLRGVTVKALTRVVDSYHDPKTKTTRPQPPYSVIERLLGRTAGTPRVLERRAVPS